VLGAQVGDLEFVRQKNGVNLFRSDRVDAAWQEQGECLIGEADLSAVGYVVGYLHGKPNLFEQERKYDPVTGLLPYERITLEGEIVSVEPEFQRQSTRPAFGRSWVDEYHGDLAKGFVSVKGKPHRIPRTYKRWLERDYPEIFKCVQAKVDAWLDSLVPFTGDSSWRRLDDREQCAELHNRGFFERSM
jgi:hypothetical protein